MSCATLAGMKSYILLCVFAVVSVGALAQESASQAGVTDEVFVACVSKGGAAQALGVADLSSKSVKITSVTPLGDGPFRYVLAVDTSNSTKPYLPGEIVFSKSLLHSVARKGTDQGGLVTFDSTVFVARGWTADPEPLVDAISKLKPGGASAVNDAIMSSIQKLDEMGGGQPRFIFLFSDFEDNQSQHTRKEVAEALLASRTHLVFIHPPEALQGGRVGKFGEWVKSLGGWSLEIVPDSAKQNRAALDELAGLFHSWYRVQLEVPSTVDRSVPLHMKTAAGCKLVAPEELMLPPVK